MVDYLRVTKIQHFNFKFASIVVLHNANLETFCHRSGVLFVKFNLLADSYLQQKGAALLAFL